MAKAPRKTPPRARQAPVLTHRQFAKVRPGGDYGAYLGFVAHRRGVPTTALAHAPAVKPSVVAQMKVTPVGGHMAGDAFHGALGPVRQPTPAAPGNQPFAGVDLNQNAVAAILHAAVKFGWKDPAALVAIAFEESGLNPRAPGDFSGGSPHSFGLFQLNDQGALGSLTPEQAFNPRINSMVAARGGASVGANRLTGAAAMSAYYTGFGRGTTNPTPRAMTFYARARALASRYGL